MLHNFFGSKEKRFPSPECKPIWLTNDAMINQYVDFIHVFELDNIQENASIYITVDSEYAFFVNGAFVDCGQYDDYPNHKAYDVINISKYLKKGKNRLCVRAYYQGEFSMQYVVGTPLLMYAVINGKDAVFSNTDDVLCRPCPSYVSGENMDKITIQVSFSFHYDASKEDDWLSGEYICKKEWRHPVISDTDITAIEFYQRPVKKQLFGEKVPIWFQTQGIFKYDTNIKKCTLGHRLQTAFLSSREESEIFENSEIPSKYHTKSAKLPGKLTFKKDIKNTYILIDLKDPQSGFFHLELDAAEGTKIDVGFGEHLDDLRVRTSVGGRSYAFSYTCKEGYQTFEHYFRRVGGRYLQIHISNMKRPVTLDYIGIIPVYYPVEYSGTLMPEDNLYKEILKGCDRTLRLCMHEHYEDCPWREQGLYAMDSRNQMLSGYYMYDNSDFALAGLTLSAEHERADGYLQNCSPCSWPTTMPSFSLEWILSLRDFVLYTGRADEIKPLYEKAKVILKKTASYFDGKLLVAPREDSIWNFYEWVDGLDDYDGLYQNRTVFRQYDAPLNALFCYAMNAMKQLTEWLDMEWHECDEVESEIRKNFFGTFCDEKKEYIYSYSDFGNKNGVHELTHAWALLAGLIPEENRQKMLDTLAVPNGKLTECTLSFCIFKYEALLLSETHSHHVFHDIAEKWGHMLYSGSRTFWETMNGADDFENAGSLCHGWAGIAAYFLYAYLLGVRPTKPGYAEYIVDPVKMKQTISGTVITPHGNISVTVENGKTTYEFKDKH